jgi:CRP-like cAMP-binding protein
VELYPGVEVLFRRDDPSAFLFVSVKGRVALVA